MLKYQKKHTFSVKLLQFVVRFYFSRRQRRRSEQRDLDCKIDHRGQCLCVAQSGIKAWTLQTSPLEGVGIIAWTLQTSSFEGLGSWLWLSKLHHLRGVGKRSRYIVSCTKWLYPLNVFLHNTLYTVIMHIYVVVLFWPIEWEPSKRWARLHCCVPLWTKPTTWPLTSCVFKVATEPGLENEILHFF